MIILNHIAATTVYSISEVHAPGRDAAWCVFVDCSRVL